MKSKYNWQEVQAYYDDGHSQLETALKFGMKPQNLSKSKHFTARPISEQRAMAVATRIKKGNIGQTGAAKEKLSKIAKDRGFGGKNYRKVFNYNGVILESSYELALARELDKSGIRWIRPKRMYWVDKNNIQHHYTADFYLVDFDIYLDPKNDYLIQKDAEKIRLCSEQNNVKIYMLAKNQLNVEAIQEQCGRGILIVRQPSKLV